MTTVIEKKISAALSAELSVNFEPYRMDEARIIIMHNEMIFPKITFDNTSKIEAKITPNVDIAYPIMSISLTGSIKILHKILIIAPLCNKSLNVSIDKRHKINKTKI